MSAKRIIPKGCLAAFDVTRFWAKVDPKAGNQCWIWQGALQGKGYGTFSLKLASDEQWHQAGAHRVAWYLANGAFPERQIDHLCRNKRCVNSMHLEDVDSRTNNLRGNCMSAINARKTHCKKGHLLEGDNLCKVYGRVCRICRNLKQIEYMRRKKAGAVATG